MEQSNQPTDQPPLPPKQTATGLEPNIAAALSYLCCWVTGLIFFLVEKDNKFIRFHALQSLIASAACIALFIGLSILGMIPLVGFLIWVVEIILGFGLMVLFIICMIKAYQGEKFRLPIVGEIAEKHA